jgi:phosphoserine phosphatase
MDLKASNLIRKYLKWSILYHFDARNKVKVIYDFEIKLPPILVSYDFDGTLTKEGSSTVFEEYLSNLCSINSMVERTYSKLKKCVEEIIICASKPPFDYEEPLKKFNEIFRNCEVKKVQHVEACIRAAESGNIKLIPYIFDTLLEQQRLNCFSGINTASPKEAVAEISRKMIGIREPRVAGSEAKFDKKGYFVEFSPNLGANKVNAMTNFFRFPENCYCDFTLFCKNEPSYIYITDDLHLDYLPAAKACVNLGVVFYVGEEFYGYVGETVVNTPEIRKDFRQINYFLNLYRRAKVFTIFHSPEIARKIIERAEKIDELASKLTEDILPQLINETYELVNLDLLFPRIKTGTGKKLFQLEKKLRKKVEVEKLKEEIREVLKLVRENEPTFCISDKRKKELSEIIKSPI